MTDQELIDQGYTEGKKSFEYLAAAIHEGFNFTNVHKAMTAVGWVWSFGKDENGIENLGVPSLETIKNHAWVILKKAYDEERHFSTGGFSAGWESGELYLVFTLEEFTA